MVGHSARSLLSSLIVIPFSLYNCLSVLFLFPMLTIYIKLRYYNWLIW